MEAETEEAIDIASLIELLGDRIILEDIKDPVKEERTKGGLIMPEQVREANKKSVLCNVLATGPGKFMQVPSADGVPVIQPMKVKKGHVVILPTYAGQEFTFKGKTYKIVNESDIQAIIPNGV